MKKATQKYASLLMIVLVAMLLVNKAIFLHSHTSNGKIYTHAHPFDKGSDNNPIKQHNHSSTLLSYLSKLDLQITVAQAIWVNFISALLFIFLAGYRLTPVERSHDSQNSRAPPALFTV